MRASWPRSARISASLRDHELRFGMRLGLDQSSREMHNARSLARISAYCRRKNSGLTTLCAKFNRPYLCQVDSYGSKNWRAMTSLSGLSNDGQMRPFPSVPASRAATELMQR